MYNRWREQNSFIDEEGVLDYARLDSYDSYSM